MRGDHADKAVAAAAATSSRSSPRARAASPRLPPGAAAPLLWLLLAAAAGGVSGGGGQGLDGRARDTRLAEAAAQVQLPEHDILVSSQKPLQRNAETLSLLLHALPQHVIQPALSSPAPSLSLPSTLLRSSRHRQSNYPLIDGAAEGRRELAADEEEEGRLGHMGDSARTMQKRGSSREGDEGLGERLRWRRRLSSDRRWPKRNLYKSVRFGKKRKRVGLLAQMGLSLEDGQPMTEEKLRKISGALAAWEAKLRAFADKFAAAPEVLEGNPTWDRLLQVRDSLRRLLLAAEMQAIDQTRM